MNIYNPTYTKGINKAEPIIFLAGPIVNANDWQSIILRYFDKLSKMDNSIKFNIANPRLNNNLLDRTEQVNWESRFLNYAGNNGIILFWLANEITHDCHRSFARTTRFELGEWLAKSMDNVMIGIDSHFDGKEYIQLRLKQMNYKYNVHDNLKDLAIDTFKQLKK